jgi:hypothetical protein
MKLHIAHLNKVHIAIGQQVNKGDVIGLMGKTGTTSVHAHVEFQKKFRTWTSYTKGLTRSQVLDYYENPYNYDWRSIAPFSHLGWDWLSDIGGGQLHPGIDINSGVGDTDLNTPVKSPISGKVIYTGNNSGWGNHIFIEESEDNVDTFTPGQAKRLYQIIGRREPENDGVTQNRGWELVEGLSRELDGNINSMQGRINELIAGQKALEETLAANKGILEANVEQIKGLQVIQQNNRTYMTYMDKQETEIGVLNQKLAEADNNLIIKLAEKNKQIEAAKKANLKGLSFFRKLMLLFN